MEKRRERNIWRRGKSSENYWRRKKRKKRRRGGGIEKVEEGSRHTEVY